MSHITEFSVEGLAGRKGIYGRKLHRDVNVFFGSNGSGKTSLFKILHSAMDSEASVLRNVRFGKASVTTFSVHFDQVFTRVIEQEQAGPPRESQSEGGVRQQITLFELPETAAKVVDNIKWGNCPEIA